MNTPASDDNVLNLASLAGAGDQRPGAVSAVIVETSDATFDKLLEVSQQVPVVVDLWATWCEPCKQLTPVLRSLAEEYAGRFLLATLDTDANPQVAQALGVQSLPTVVAIIKGQLMPLFTGAQPAPQVRAVIDEVLRVAGANGVTGRIDTSGSGEIEPPPPPPLHVEGMAAIERGDLAAAERAFAQALKENPADQDAKSALAQVRLMMRAETLDAASAIAAADAAPGDVEAALTAADAQYAAGDAAGALDRLLTLIIKVKDDEREQVRTRLVEYFDTMDPADPLVISARRRLFSALF